MANSAQARKRARQNTKSRLHNASQRSSMRTHIKSFLKALQQGNREEAESAYRAAVSRIDRAGRRGLQHHRKGARLKSRLNARLKQLAA